VLFHSLQFLLFLPLALTAWWTAADRPTLRKVILVVASLVFYMAWSPAPVVLLLFLTFVDWAVGRGLAVSTSTRGRRALLALSLANNLVALGVFKYADWLTRIVVDAAAWCGVTLVYRPLGLLLPVGLSFLVFQGMSYTIDVYRRDLVARRSFLDVLAFMTFFPHVVAGPIVRAADFLPQLGQRPHVDDDTGGRAIFRIVLGLGKKLVVADLLEANLVSRVFADANAATGLDVTAAVVGYTLQIYYDFSAYSDIAIGTAALFGFTLKENFDKPYLSANLFDFWRRWHMSLNTWLRDYLYIPLGGNRGNRAHVLGTVFVTMVVAGVWHGADGRFLVWGALHGILLCVVRLWWWTVGRAKHPSILRTTATTLLTFVVVVELRIIFRAPDLDAAAVVFTAQGAHWAGLAAPLLTPIVVAVLVAAVVGHLVPHATYHRLAGVFARAPLPVRAVFLLGTAIFLQQVSSAETTPFIYSRF
jgi:D-alanyl-lipoteichoic acid acyltransferase DltB (MBOAT superfamily)